MAQILCTLGPASMNDRTIKRLEGLGVGLFRINLSHTPTEEIERTIKFIQKRTSVPVCLDTEGAQVRTGRLPGRILEVKEGAVITLNRRFSAEDSAGVSLTPQIIFDDLDLGDFISIDFNHVFGRVISTSNGGVRIKIYNGGIIGENKAVTIHRRISLPALSEKDKEAIRIGRELGLRHVAVSFAQKAQDAMLAREMMGNNSFVISKIETKDALINLDDILAVSDAVLIDRGDLSREIPIERIPVCQKDIMRKAKDKGVDVYVATNFLESMITSPSPTRAEVNDIFNTLKDGADGLVLAAETAIGKYPIECASMIRKLILEYSSFLRDREGVPLGNVVSNDPADFLIEPHGGRLVQRIATAEEAAEVDRIRSFRVTDEELLDAEQIAAGTYSPLEGFMDRRTLQSVLDGYCLPNGVLWPMPIILRVSRETAEGLSGTDRVVLRRESGDVHSILCVKEVYKVDKEVVAEKWFGTRSHDHPGVKDLFRRGEYVLAGNVSLVKPIANEYSQYVLSPKELRFIFSHKGWSRIVGFHTRNPAHRVHEYIQNQAIEKVHADGLLISPVIGMKKPGDFLPNAILKTYEALIRYAVYPSNNAVLGAFNTYSRYAGPREAVFTALCRKNMGCSHFIVGRDHTGVGRFYHPKASQELFEKLGDIGIIPIFYEAIGFDEEREEFVPSDLIPHVRAISGTDIRTALFEGRYLPDWMMRGIVQDVLHAELADGRQIFQL